MHLVIRNVYVNATFAFYCHGRREGAGGGGGCKNSTMDSNSNGQPPEMVFTKKPSKATRSRCSVFLTQSWINRDSNPPSFDKCPVQHLDRSATPAPLLSTADKIGILLLLTIAHVQGVVPDTNTPFQTILQMTIILCWPNNSQHDPRNLPSSLTHTTTSLECGSRDMVGGWGGGGGPQLPSL